MILTKKKIIDIFKKQNLLDTKISSPFSVVHDFLKDIFDPIEKRNISEDETFSISERVSSWTHILDLDVAWRCYNIDRQALINAASYYIKNDVLWCAELDWFYVNSLIFAELIATQKHYYSQLLPFSKFMWLQTTPRSFSFKLILWRAICSLTKWGILIFLAIILFTLHTILGSLFLSFVVGIIIYNRVEKRKKLKALSSMVKTYLQTQSINISWRVLREEMDESRKLYGAIWDMEVYKLVDLRL